MPSDTNTIMQSLDLDDVSHFADINGNAPDLAIALNQRYGARIDVVGLNKNGRHEPISTDAAKRYIKYLEKHGVDNGSVHFVQNRKDTHTYDVIAAFDSFGSRTRISPFRKFLSRALHAQCRLVIDVKKGSGSYPFLNEFGSCNTLTPVTSDTIGKVIMSVEPKTGPAGEWSDIALKLAGKDGFYTDCGDHSFLHIKRNDTLVVTFDNLDIAMTKRDDRRPWGFNFIEAQGWSMLGVMANGWTWFRDEKVVAEFDRLRDSGFFKQFKRVVFYGASMGGYAAAAYSSAAEGATVLAISPQSTLDKTIVPWEMRYKKVWESDFSGHYGDASLVSQKAAKVHIFYDPYVVPDAAHIARFTGDNVVRWRCPLLGHRLGSSLSQMGILQEIMRDTITGDLDDAQFYKLLRKRRDFPRYQRELANLAMERGRPELTARVCRFVLAQRNDKFFNNLSKRIKSEAS